MYFSAIGWHTKYELNECEKYGCTHDLAKFTHVHT